MIDNITVTNVVWSGTTSQTYGYYVYRSVDGLNYDLIGISTGTDMHFDDHDSSAETYYYQVTAINSIVGGECESAPAMAVDGIHNFVTAHTDGVDEQDASLRVYPNPTHGQVTIEAKGLNHVTVMNALGQTIYDHPADAVQTVLNLSQYGAGLYLIRINSESGVSVKQVSVVR